MSPNEDIFVSGSVFVGNRRAIVGRARIVIHVHRNDFWRNHHNIVAGPKPTYDCGPDSGGWEIHENDILRGPRSRWYSNDVRTTPGSNESAYYVSATRNWWGTTDASAIDARILDGNDDFRFKDIDVTSPSTGPHTAWVPPGRIGNPDPEPTSHGDALTRSYIEEPNHGDCVARRAFRAVSGRAQGHLGPLKYVDLSLRRKSSNGCSWWSHSEGKMVARPCAKPLWFRARGTDTWSYRFARSVRRGKYVLWSRSNGEGGFETGRNKIGFRLIRN